MTAKKSEKEPGSAAKKPAGKRSSQKNAGSTAPAEPVPPEPYFAAIFEHAPAPALILDDNDTILHVNRRFAALSGFSLEEVNGRKKWMEFVSSADVAKLQKYHGAMLSGKESAEIQVPITFVSRTGTTREMLAVAALVPKTRQILVSLLDTSAQVRYRELVDAPSPFAIMTTDPEGVITMFGAGSERLLGYPAAEVVGKATPLIFLAERELALRSRKIADETGVPALGFDIFSRIARERGSEERQWTCIRRDGSAVTVSFAITAMKDPGESIAGYFCIAQELTDQRRVEESFRTSGLQMSGVIYNLPDATFAIDREGKVIAWNRAIEELTGVRAVDILGKGGHEYAIPFYQDRRPMLVDLVGASDRKIESWGFSEITRTKNSVTAETSDMHPLGRTMEFRVVASPIYDETGNIAGAIESLIDISEITSRESALEVSIAQYRTILDNTGAATAIIEPDATISFMNPEFGKVLGYTREEIEGKRKWTEFVLPEDSGTIAMFRAPGPANARKAPAKFDLRFIRWDGELRNGLATVNAIPDTGQYVLSLLDITDKILAEDACQRANRKLNFFNSITRHEILNQLTALRGNLELALARTTDETARTILKKELAAADAIEAQILFTRDYQDIGQQPAQWQDAATVIRKACRGVPTGAAAIEITISGVMIYADMMLEKVFFHLARNAVQYGEKTTLIRFSCAESFEELLIVCEDDGIGIPPEAKEKVFNRQFFKNTGLDLLLSREILSLTGIGIRETGTYGKGARFELRVPKGAYRFTASPGS